MTLTLTPIQERRRQRDLGITRDWAKGIVAGKNRTALRLWICEKYAISTAQFYHVLRHHRTDD